jgi:outer membrane immunogenic protein
MGDSMKKILAAGIAAAAFCGATAFAADMPTKGPVYKAAPMAVLSWNGCYIGGNAGGGWARKQWTLESGAPGLNDGSDSPSGFVGGVQTGCDYQNGPWVFGFQGMFDWTNLKADHVTPSNTTDLAKTTIPWLATATGRIGYTVAPSALLYAKGGLAWVRDEHSILGPARTVIEGVNVTRSGWTLGGGLEWLFRPNWSLFVEYDYMDFGNGRTERFTGCCTDFWKIKQKAEVVLVGLNYRFGDPWGKSPVVAKY